MTTTRKKTVADVDPKYPDAVALAQVLGYVSCSALQRRLVVGYVRATRMIDRMRREGLVELRPGTNWHYAWVGQADKNPSQGER